MNAVVGYARVSTLGQELDIQIEKLKAAGATIVRSEKRTGTTIDGRDELKTAIDFMRSGDVLLVTKIDRLARSLADLSTLVRDLEARGIALRCVDQPVDTSTAAGKAFLGMLGVFAEFETNLRRERQLEGIAKAKAHGVYKGRRATPHADEIRRLASCGVGASEIARQLGLGRTTVHKYLRTAAAAGSD